MTQELYQKAMRFAGEKHANQLVPGSKANYLLHISTVCMEVILAHKHEDDFDLNLAMQAAILHDTIEDTDTSYEEVEENFGSDVAQAVSALSKDKQLPTKREQMEDSLDRILALSKEVGIVKMADRISNLQGPPYHWGNEKATAYREEAKLIHQKLGQNHAYLRNRLWEKIEAYKRFL